MENSNTHFGKFTYNKLRALRGCFEGDQLGFLDADQRERVESILPAYADPDTVRKRLLLAAFYAANGNSADISTVYGNLDATIRQFYGKDVSFKTAYGDAAKMVGQKAVAREQYAKEHPMTEPAGDMWRGVKSAGDFVQGYGRGSGGPGPVTKAAVAGLGKTLAAAAVAYVEGQATFQSYSGRGVTAAGKAERAAIGAGTDVLLENTVKPLKDIAERNTAQALDEGWISKWNGGRWLLNAGKFLAIQAPQQAAQLAAAYHMGPVAFAGALGAATGAEKYYDLKWDAPEMSDADKMKNAALTGFINSGTAWLTAGIVKGRIPGMNKISVKKNALDGIKWFAAATGAEAGQEAAEQLAENTADIYTGVYGEPGKLSPEEFRNHLWNGVAESALAGGVFGLGGAAVGYGDFKARREELHGVVGQIEAERDRLMQLEEPTDAELRQLEDANTALESRDMSRLQAAARGIADVEAMRQSQKALAAAGFTDDDIALAEAERGVEDYTLRHKLLPHDPAETVATANALMSNFPAFKLDIANTSRELAKPVLDAIEAAGIELNRVRAWVDDTDTVHMVAANVRPSEVARTLGHEIIGHKGLRAVFGQNFDDLLDLVYRDHAEEVQQLSESYHRDTETVENQRYLTEEFLANCANAETKPGWWRELLNRIKNGLRRLPGLSGLRFSDRDIEYALMRSARAMRRADAENAPVGGGRLLVRRQMDDETRRMEAENLAGMNSKLNSAIDGYLNGTVPKGKEVEIGATPDALVLAGIKQLPINFNTALIEKAKTKHGLTDAELRQIPDALANPVMVFTSSDRSTNFEHGFVVVTQIRDAANNPVLVPLNVSTLRQQHIVNDIASVYGKDGSGWVNQWIDEGRLRYLNKKRARVFARSHRLQLPSEATLNTRYADTIIDDSFDVKPGSEENIKFSVAPPVDSEAFKKWFGDSKVVDADGKPLVVYHGSRTGGGFNIFSDNSFFSDNFDVADMFKREADYILYVNGKRAGTFSDFDANEYASAISNYDYTADEVTEWNNFDLGEMEDVAMRSEVVELIRARTHWQIPADEIKTVRIEKAPPVTAVYLNIRNPKIIDFEGRPWRADKSSPELIMKDLPAEFDGLIVKNIIEGGFTGELRNGEEPPASVDYIPRHSSQIKSATDNIGTYDSDNPDIRYSLAEYSEADQRDIVAILRPFVGKFAEDEEAVVKYLAERGVEIGAKDARYFALEAARENMAAARRRAGEQRDRWLYETQPLWRAAVDAAGGDTNFKIRPSFRFAGEAFTGSFISPEFVKYSEKKTKAKGKAAEAYGGRRNAALKSAEGIGSEAIAEAMARETGRDPLELEQEIIGILPRSQAPGLAEDVFGVPARHRNRRQGRRAPDVGRVDGAGIREDRRGGGCPSRTRNADHRRMGARKPQGLSGAVQADVQRQGGSERSR